MICLRLLFLHLATSQTTNQTSSVFTFHVHTKGNKMHLLSLNNKLAKSIAVFKVLTAGLFLAPHKRSGHNVCKFAGHCSAVCNLWFSGRTVTEPVRQAMLRRTRLYFENPAEFFDFVYSDIAYLERKAIRESKRLFIRLNGSSDLDFSQWANEFPAVEFYDYTKWESRIENVMQGNWPANYALCYSFNERSNPLLCRDYLSWGGSVAMVFDTEYCPQHKRIGELPKTVKLGGKRFKIIDGDIHDLRHPDFDNPGCVVGLRFKGSRSRLPVAIEKGFVRKTR